MTSTKTSAIALCAAACLTLAACGGSGDKNTDSAAATGTKEATQDKATSQIKPVKVVATTTQICDYVTQIATDNGDDANLAFVKTDSAGKTTSAGAAADKATSQIDLTCLLAPNASAHNHEMTPQQMKALGDADVFFVSGVDLEHFLDKAVESSGFHGTMAVTTGVLTTADIDDLDGEIAKENGLPYTIDRGVAKVEVAPWPFAPEPGEEPEFRFDPHVWTSPANAIIQVKNIGAALEKASPANKELFTKHVNRYEKQLESLDKWSKDAFDSVPDANRVLFTSHDAFGYLSNEYNIKFIGAALSDFNEQSDATAEHIATESQKVKDSGARALFAENSNNSKSVEAIAKAAGVKAVTGEDALYGDSLGPAGSDGETYIGAIIHNVTNLVTAWEGTVPELPKDLKPFAPKQLEN